MPKEKVQAHLPEEFGNFQDTQVILDCTELRCQTPSSLLLQSEVFSNYKSHCTFKALTGMAPHGAITFVSGLFAGSISDREMFRQSGIIPLLTPDMAIMVDKGFLVDDLVPCKIHRPVFLKSGSFLYSIGDAEHVSKATVCRSVQKVSLALKRLVPSFVVFPGHKPVVDIKEEFYNIAGFPRVIGCIDGTHIPITAPSEHEGDYVNRKSIHSINVQIICDASHLITNVEARWPGSVHDSRIFRESALSNKFQHGRRFVGVFHMDCNSYIMEIPYVITGQYDGLLLGDRGYPCLPYLMTPYSDPAPGPQSRFNQAHGKTRARIEMTLGILKARFQCLKGLRVTPDRACNIILACVVLHNIATIQRERQPTISDMPTEELGMHVGDNRDGRVVRDSICNHSFS
ncbi:hypothetical protein MHYP_G00217270 [Metynnis hypsauchen]